ncbi:hypothetical protein BDZ91DRAFT_779280 [Kalaharituber pfeilii]|nr:hypothetical protein BDZ91DRAFT_779280 [Kalaharituber pfeilii]
MFMKAIPALGAIFVALSFVWAEPSPDGSCGVKSNSVTYECWGDMGCCSSSGWCGNSTAHCSAGCQRNYSVSCGPPYSFDNTCGGETGYICKDSCCSQYGFCGNSTTHCGVGCQAPFSENCAEGILPTIDGRCGAAFNTTCTGSESWNQMCCSAGGYCGTTPAHCANSVGCQNAYGTGCY